MVSFPYAPIALKLMAMVGAVVVVSVELDVFGTSLVAAAAFGVGV